MPAAYAWSLWGADTPDSLVGTYAYYEGGHVRELIRVGKRGDTFFLQEGKPDGTEWNPEQPVIPLDKALLESIIERPAPPEFVALGTKGLAVIKAPKGWKESGFESKTGYVLATMLGPLELHRQ